MTKQDKHIILKPGKTNESTHIPVPRGMFKHVSNINKMIDKDECDDREESAWFFFCEIKKLQSKRTSRTHWILDHR